MWQFVCTAFKFHLPTVELPHRALPPLFKPASARTIAHTVGRGKKHLHCPPHYTDGVLLCALNWR